MYYSNTSLITLVLTYFKTIFPPMFSSCFVLATTRKASNNQSIFLLFFFYEIGYFIWFIKIKFHVKWSWYYMFEFIISCRFSQNVLPSPYAWKDVMRTFICKRIKGDKSNEFIFQSSDTAANNAPFINPSSVKKNCVIEIRYL